MTQEFRTFTQKLIDKQNKTTKVFNVRAKTLVDANGNDVVDGNGNKIWFPEEFDPAAAIAFGRSLASKSLFDAGEELRENVRQGGQWDLQRTYNGRSNNLFASLFQPAASYTYGLIGTAAGLPKPLLMVGGGLYNIVKNPGKAGLDFGNNPENVPFIKQGIRDYSVSRFTSSPSSSDGFDRFGEWGSVPAPDAAQPASDGGTFASRFGNWGVAPAGDLGRAMSPGPSGRRSDASEAAPDGSAPLDSTPAQPVRVLTKFVDGRAVGFPPIDRSQDASADSVSPSALGPDDGPLTLKQAYLQYAARRNAARAADMGDTPKPMAYPNRGSLPAWPGPAAGSAMPSASGAAVVQSPVAQWLAGLAGVDPPNPDQLALTPFSGTAWDAPRDTSWDILTRRARTTR